MTTWTPTQVAVLRRQLTLSETMALLPGRSVRSIRHKAYSIGVRVGGVGSAVFQPWQPEEKEILRRGLTLSETVALLPNRSPGAVKRMLPRKEKAEGPTTTEVGPVEDDGWSKDDLTLIAQEIPARRLLPLLSKPRTVWAINRKRRELNLARPQIGRPALSPTNFPGVDWAASTLSISRATGLAWVTVRKLKQGLDAG